MNLEYDNYYKFLVSLGIGLVALAAFVPWLFLKAPLDLLIKQEDIAAFTPVAQSIIQDRQNLVECIIDIIPWFSIISFTSGIVMIFYGAFLWRKRTQTFLDKQKELEVEILKQQLNPAAPKDVETKREIEAELELKRQSLEQPIKAINSESGHTELKVRSVINKVAETEEVLIEKFQDCFGSSYDVLSNQRLGDVIFDVILLSRIPINKSFVIEIKYIAKKFNYDWLRSNALKISHKNKLYQLDASQIPIPVLLVVGPERILSSIAIEEYKARIERERIFRKGKSRIIFLNEEDLEKITCDQLKRNF